MLFEVGRRGGRMRWLAGAVALTVAFAAGAQGRGGLRPRPPAEEQTGGRISALIQQAQEQERESAYADAERTARQALALAEKRDSKRAIGMASGILGTALVHLGHASEAEPLLRLSLPLREAEFGPNHQAVLSVMGLLGVALSQQAKYAEAEQVLAEVLKREASASQPGSAELTRSHMQYGLVLSVTARYAAAEEQFRKAIENGSAGSDERNPRLLAQTSFHYARMLVQAHRNDEALAESRRAVSLVQSAYPDESSQLARTMVVLAQALVATGAFEEAEPLLARVAPMAEKLLGASHFDTATANLLLGVLAERSGHFPEAEAAMKQGLEALGQYGAPTQLAPALANYARFLERRGRDAESLAQFKTALDTVDRMYAATRGLDEATREAFAGKYAPLYYETVRLLIKMHRTDPRGGYDREALSVVSRTQSRLFAEMLRQADVRGFSNDPEFRKLAEQRDSVLQRLAQARGTRAERVPVDDSDAPRGRRGELARARALGASADAARRLSSLEGDLKTVEDRLMRDYPRYMELIRPRPLAVAELQRLLKPGEAVLSYFILERETLVFLVTPTQFAMRPAGIARKELAELVWKARHTSEDASSSFESLAELDPAVLNRLYQVLVQPVEEFVRPGQKLLVVGDGPVYTLPLEMLVTSWGAPERERFAATRAARAQPLSEYGTLAYLGDRYHFTYLPNLAALVSQRQYAKPPVAFDRELVSFADPVFARDDVKSAASDATRSLLASMGAKRSGSSLLPRLPETADEARGIAKVLGGKSQIYLRGDAQEHTAKTADLHATRFVHFATHGLLGGEFLLVKQSLAEDNAAAAGNLKGTQRNLAVAAAAAALEDAPAAEPPQPSQARKGGQPALALSLVDTQGEDGLLTMSEVIENLNINADLVVLSACNTAGESAEASSGEGFAGLTRAFMYAGARSLMVSHWSVDSVSTTMLVTNAFGALKSGQPLEEALRQARAGVRASSTGAYSRAHPFFWAPFVQIGD